MTAVTRPVDLLLGRGGVRGIAMVGAVAGLHAARLEPARLAGVSAGALVSALLAAGYRGDELRRAVWSLDLERLRDVPRSARIPLVGPALSLLTQMGFYRGDALLEAFRALLASKGVHAFGDLREARIGGEYRLRVVVADVTRARIVVLPDDAPLYGIDPDALEVALALRMSTSIPFFFRPLRFGRGEATSLMLDGGLLAALPFRLLESHGSGAPVIGIEAVPPCPRSGAPRRIRGPAGLLRAAYYTALIVNSTCHRAPAEAGRTIEIDCGLVGSTQFRLTDVQKQALYDAGRAAAESFLGRWTYDVASSGESVPAAAARLRSAG